MKAGSGCVWWWLLVDWCEEWCVIYLLWHIWSYTNLVFQILCGFFHFLVKVLQLRMRGIAPCAAQNVCVCWHTEMCIKISWSQWRVIQANDFHKILQYQVSLKSIHRVSSFHIHRGGHCVDMIAPGNRVAMIIVVIAMKFLPATCRKFLWKWGGSV